MIATTGRYLRTLRHVPPAQLFHRVRLRTQRSWYRRRPERLEARWGSGTPSTGRWPEDFGPIDTELDHAPPADDGSITLVGETHRPLADGWRPAGRSQLFRYHLHYFDWAWALAADHDRDRFGDYWASWRADTTAGRWDEWSPYVVSLRAWTLCGLFDSVVRASDVERDVTDHLRACLGFLERNLELDVGGNHLIKNLKAIIGLAAFFDQRDRLETAQTRLQQQVDLQVLADGGHFELSPSYHAQVLADLIDIDELLASSGRGRVFSEPITRMRAWLSAMTYPDGSLPLVGDCTPPPRGLLAALGTDRRVSTDDLRVELLADTGYVVARPRPGAMIVIDVGHPCPPELPAHAQADWGTFEVWLDGLRAVADPGVSTYVGDRRAWERSTEAHNTVTIGGQNQTEVWASFRAGRLAIPGPVSVTEQDDVVTIEAELGGLTGDSTHRRRFEITPSTVQVLDAVTGEDAASHLLVTSDRFADKIGGTATVLRSSTTIGVGFGRTEGAIRLEQQVTNGRAGWTIPITQCAPAGGGNHD